MSINWLEHRPVTPEVAGSSPVILASKDPMVEWLAASISQAAQGCPRIHLISYRRVAPWRPPTDLHPERAGCHQLRSVQLQTSDRGTTAWRQTEDFRAVLTPGEVIGPFLTSRIPQSDTFPADGIPYVEARALEFVACMAGKPEITLDGLTSLGFGDDMLDAQTKACDALGCPAVSAAMTGHPGHALAQGARHASFAGYGQRPSGFGSRCPRYFSSRAA